ncbi:MAG: hypothetical protein JKY67_20945 [Pseudomonadales bacterium]|nr:hypothetical protein [Pseudomonadales bacterium]
MIAESEMLKRILGTLALLYIILSCGGGGGPNDTAPTEDITGNSNDTGGNSETTHISVLYEAIPGSLNHSPDGTWWGYNQSKIVRFGDFVFMAVVENSDDATTPSQFTLYKKEGDGDWSQGAQLSTSVPGNLLIDSTGILHAFVFVPTVYEENRSIGQLKHYWFTDAATGDITNYLEETVIDNDGESETVNVRVGAAMGSDDTLSFAFGLRKYDEAGNNDTQQLFVKSNDDTQWSNLEAGDHLGHDFFYPFVLIRDDGYSLLPVQDDFMGVGNTNRYQKILYFEYQDGSWSNELIVDLTEHTMAASRARLLEQSDMFEASDGTVHVIYKEFLDPDLDWKVTTFKHLKRSDRTWTTNAIDLSASTVNWLRILEYEEEIYFLCATSDALYLMKEGSTTLTQLEVPSDALGIYPYYASPRSGTSTNESYLDILMLSGGSNAYPNAPNYYVRIAKSELSKVQ